MAAQEVADLSGDTISDMDSGEYIEDAGCDLQAAAHALEQLHMYDRPINCVDLCRLIEIANQYYFRLARLDGRQHQDPQYEGAFLRPLLREGIPAAFNRLMFDEHTPGPDSSVTAHIHAACCGLARLAQVLLLYLWRTDAFSPMLQAQTRLDLSGPLTALTNVLTAQAAFNVRNRCAGPPNGIPIAHPVLAGQRVHDAFRKHQSDLFGTLLFEKLRDVHRQQLASAATGEQGTATSTAPDASRPAPSSQQQHGDAHLSLQQTTQRTSQVELQADCLRKAHATLSDQTYLSQLMSDVGEYFFIHNVINHFNQGFDVIAQALKRPDRCGIVGCLTLLQPLQVMFQWLASVNFIKLLPAIQAVLGYIEAGLGAAADFSAFEDSGDDDTREVHAPLLQVVQICWSYSRHPSQLPQNEAASLEARAAALHRETVLRLLASGNFTRQLVGVKEVHTVISRAQWVDSCTHPPSDAPSPDATAAGGGGGDGDATGLDNEEESPTTATMMIEAARRGPGSDAPDAGTAGEAPAAVPDEHREDKAAGRIAGVQPDTRGEDEVGDDDKAPANAVMIEHALIQPANPTVGACMSAVLAWFRDNDVVRRILRANLHQSQFVDAAQKALVELLQYDAVEEEHVDFLWHVLEDPTAFEDIKANIYALLGALAPRMRVQQRTNLFSRLCSRLEVPGDVPDLSHVIDMLESMALNDDRGELADDVLRVLLDLVLRDGVPQDVATSPALVNACAAYELSSYNWSATVVNACKAAMNREERGVTVAAAYQLRAIIAFACAKKATQNQFFGRYNRNAALLQHALVSFEAFLEAQAAAAHDAGVPLAKGATPGLGPPYDDAPPASPFTHSTAVHVWHELLLDLVRKGNYFITEQQVVQISSWATVKSVTDVDAAAAWDLLVELVKGRKEINFDVANAFLEVLRATDPIAITQPAWRCITAYAAALSDWTVSIDEDAQTKTFVSSIMPTLVYPEDSRGFLNMLDALALDAPSYAASNSARVLAQLLTLPLSQANDEQSVLTQMGLISTHVNAWRQVLIDATKFLYGRLPNTWHELPLAGEKETTADSTKRFVSQLKLHAPGLIGNTVSTGAGRDADDGDGGAVFGSSGAATQLVVRRASRALTCLQNIVSYGRLKAMPRRFAHSASYRDVDIVLDLQLHSVHALTQQPAEAKAGPVRLPISLAGNAYMGAVRLQAAKSASEYVGRAVEAQYLRVIGTGRDFSNDNQQLSTTTITSCIMVAPCAAPLPFADPARRPLIDLADPCPFIISGDGTSSERKDIEQGQEERHQQLFYGVLLALAQAQPPQELSASLESVHEFNGLQVQARNLLNVLPTCTQAVADVEAVLSMAAEKAPKALYDLASCPDMSQDRRASAITMTRQQPLPNDRRINAQVLQYLAEVFCSLIRPADNPLEDEEMAQQRAHRALDALRNLFESHVITALFELAVEHPFAGGPNTALATHAGLLLIASDVIDAIAAELSASSNTRGIAPSQPQQQQRQGTATGPRSGIALPSENVSKVIHSLARFALAALHAALSKYRPPALLHEASATRAEGCLQKKPSGGVYGPSEALLMQQGEMLSKRALELLARCMNLDPSVARAITAPPTAPPHAADEEQGPGVSESHKGADGAHLAALVNQLLSHDSQSLRGLTSAWLVRIANASQEMRQWAFVGVICPIVLGSAEANAEQSELCSRFLSSIGDNVEEIQQASEVLDALVQHLLRNARDEKSSAPLGTAAENAMALFKRLECYNVDSARELVSVLLNQALFPEVDLLAEATREAIQHGAERAAALVLQRYPHVLRAARRTSNCRECCMDLVSELITHDRGCWEIGCAALHRLMEASAAAFLRQTDNKPLTTLRPCGALAGLHNGGATCYMNATFQQLYMQPTVRRLVLSAPTVPIGEQDESVFHQVQRAFAHLEAGIEPSFEPRGFWRAFKDYEGRPVNIREHQDAYEFFTRLQDSVDEHLRSVNAPPAIQAALGGSFATVMTVPGRPDLLSERDEDFYQISLDVRGKKGLIESLDSYVAPESLDGPNQWLCEALGTKVDAEKRTLIRRLPHTLMLHLKRFEWDHETWTRWKVKDRFEFPMRLNMKPYTVEGSMDVEVCHATTRDESDAMDATKQQASPSSPSSRAGVDRENARYVYELRGVVVHSGTAFAGHYYSYIQDRATKRWHCFDDVNVDSWDPRCLEEDCFGGKYVPEGTSQEYDRPHSAYMLVYERVVGEDSIATRASSTGDTLASDAAEKTVMVERQRGRSVRPRQGGRVDEEALTQPAMPKADVSSPSSSGQPSPGVVLGVEDPVASMHAAGMHASLQADISWGNVRRLAVAHLLGFEFMTVFQVIATEARFAAGGGVTRPRKAQRIAGLTSPGGGTLAMARIVASMTAASQGLARLTTRRGGGPHTSGNSAADATTSDAHGSARCDGDLGMVLAQAISLFMEYMCRIAARGPMDLANHVGAPFTSRKSRAHIFQSNLSIVDNCPAAAHAVLRFTGSPRTSQAFLAALECEIEAIFAAARLLVCRAARSLLYAEGMDAAAAGMAPTIDELFAYLKSSVQRRPKSYWLWEPILSTLAQLATNIFDDEADAALLFTPHLQVLLDVGRPLVNTAHRLPAADRIDAEFPGCYLTLLSLVLRQFSTNDLAGMALPHEEGVGNVDGEDATMLEDDAARRGDVGDENPELLHPRGVQGAPDPLAVEAWDFLFADPDFLRRLLYPGALSGDGPRRLLVWLTWNNSLQRTALVRAFLGHILFDCQQDIVSMLIDVPATMEAVGIGDNCVEERYKEMLFGAAPPEHDPQAAAVEGLVSAAARAKSHARMMALTRAVLLMEEAQPLAWRQAWQWAEEVRLTAETGAEWAAKQLTRVREFEDVLADDPDKKQAWEEKLREAGDDCSWNYRTTELDTHLMRLVGDDGALWQGFWDNGGEGAGEEQCGEGQQQGTSTGSGWEAYDEAYDGGADNRYQAGNERQGEGDKENTQQQQQPFTDKIAAGAAAPSLQHRSLTHALGLGYGLIHGSGFASRQGASVAGVSAGASNPLPSLSALRTIDAAPASEPQPRGADIVAGGGHGNGKDDEDVVAEITFDEDIADEEGARGCGE